MFNAALLRLSAWQICYVIVARAYVEGRPHLLGRPESAREVDDDVRMRSAALLPLVDIDIVVSPDTFATHGEVYAFHEILEHLQFF